MTGSRFYRSECFLILAGLMIGLILSLAYLPMSRAAETSGSELLCQYIPPSPNGPDYDPPSPCPLSNFILAFNPAGIGSGGGGGGGGAGPIPRDWNPWRPQTPAAQVSGGKVAVASGTVAIQGPTVSLGGPSFGWSHGADYNSGLVTLSSGNSSLALGNNGQGWLSGSIGPYIRHVDATDTSTDIELIQSASFKQIFTNLGGGVFTPPPGSKAALEVAGSGSGQTYTLTNYEDGTVAIFYAPTLVTTAPGRLKERTSREFLKASKSGMKYYYAASGSNAGLVEYITDPNMWVIDYVYDGSGRLSAVEVHSGALLTTNIIEKIEYTYFNSSASHHSNVGGTDDLVQVKVSRKASDDTGTTLSIAETTQYRYYNGPTNGKAHQMKMTLDPAAIERIIAAVSGVNTADDILTKDDSVVQAYANEFYTYYTSDEGTTSVATPWGGSNQNLQSLYGGTTLNELGLGGLGRVKTQTSNGDCGSCGGGAGSNVTKTWFYMSQTGAGSDLSNVETIVVEDTSDSVGAVYRTVTGLNQRGAAVREAVLENPAGTLKASCTSLKLNSNNQITEHRAPSAHTIVTTTTIIKQFFNPATAGNDAASLDNSSGVVTLYEYDGNKNQTGQRVKNGESSSSYYVSATDWVSYGDRYLPSYRYEYPVQATANSRTSADRGVFGYAYTFWGTGSVTIATVTTTAPAISSTAENGSGVSSTSGEYFDNLGRLRWTQDGEGYCSYYSYHPINGRLALRIDDIDPGSPGSEVTSGSAYKWDSWTVGGALASKPTRSGLPAVIAETTKTEYDDLGRTYLQIDDDASKHYTVYGDNRTSRLPYWDGSKSLLPITVNLTNEGGQTTESFQIKAGYTGSGVTVVSSQPVATGAPGVANYVAWTRNFYDSVKGKLVKQLTYHTIPSSGSGSHITNYYVTGFEYDNQGRVKNKIETSTSTRHQVTQTVYDWMGRGSQVYQGAGNVTGLNTGASNILGTLSLPALAQILALEYDGGLVGDGRVTSSKRFFGATAGDDSTDFIETQPQYNWRGFVRGAIQKKNTTVFGPYQVLDVDWKGRVTGRATYSTAPTWSSVIANDGFVAANASNRNNWTRTYYDKLGQVFRTLRYPGSEATKHFQTDNFYDRNGQLVGSQEVNGMGTETAFDGLGRAYQTRDVTTLESAKYSSGKFNYRSPIPTPDLSIASGDTGGNDLVFTMQHTVFDDGDNGNVIGQHSFDANHDDTNGLSLSTNTDYVRTTSYLWYDTANRPTAIADYGSGNGSGVNEWKYTAVTTRPGSAPSSGDAVPVSSVTYNASTGRAEVSTDPLGRKIKKFYDALGREMFTVENFVDFNATTLSGVGGGTGNEQDQVTGITYNGVGGVYLQTAYNAGQTNQVTTNLFEDPVDATRVTKTIYPDYGQKVFAFHRDGLLDNVTDQRGVKHTFTYENRRNVTLDAATNITGVVDPSVASIGKTYDSLARPLKITSFDGMSAVVNEVQFAYNAEGNIQYQYQQVNGAVNTGTSPKTQYAYDTSTVTVNGELIYDDGLRQTTVTYPKGRVVTRSYGTAGVSLTDFQNRVERIQEPGNLGIYKYTAAGRLVENTLLPITVATNYHNGDSDGIYERFDRHGRPLSVLWHQYGAAPTFYPDLFTYTYDRLGNRLTKDIWSTVYPTDDQDQKLVYDGLNRLSNFEQGTLSGTSIGSRNKEQLWTQDQLSNWTNFKERDTDTGSTWDLNQNRVHNTTNEITSIAGSSTHVAHDAAGSMTKVSDPGNWSAHYDLKYDAWDRTVEVKLGATVLQKNQYDGFNRRIVRDETGASGGDKRHFYYDGQQVVEERKVVGSTEDPDPINVYTYHPFYIDAVLCRDYDSDVNGTSDRYYYLYDTTFNVTTLMNASRVVVERYLYDPYGQVSVLEPTFTADPDNKSDYGNEITFTGRRLDPSTGLFYFRARYYSGQLGRFISRDPIGYADGMSFYRGYFVPNGVDPLGLLLLYDDPVIITGDNTANEAEGMLGGPYWTPGSPQPVNRPNGEPWFDYEPRWIQGNGQGDRNPDWYCTQLGDNTYCFKTSDEMIRWRHEVDTLMAAGQHVENAAWFGFALWWYGNQRPQVPDFGGLRLGPNNPNYPRNPNDWTVPKGWKETSAGDKTGGKHRQWIDETGKMRRRWDASGREAGKERGPHWHDLDDASGGTKHICPGD